MTMLHALAVTVAAGFASLGTAQTPPPRPASGSFVTASGTAQVMVDPDLATVRLGIVTQAKDAKAAQRATSAILTKILAAAQRVVSGQKAYQSVELNLSPLYSEPKPGQPTAPEIVGYRASQILQVRVEDLTKVGDMIDAAVAAGASNVDSISFGLRDESAAQISALRVATKNALAKAAAIVEALGKKLGDVTEIGDQSQSIRPVFRQARMADAGFAAAPMVAPGQIEVSVTVTGTWKIE